MGNSPTYRGLHLLIDLFKLRTGVGLVNLVQLGIISSGTIYTITSSSPRSTRSSIAFMCRTFVLIGELIKINITLGNNRLGIRIIHTTVNDHLIHTTELFILFIHNRPGTKHLITPNHICWSAIRNRSLGNIFIRSNLHCELTLLHILRLDARILLPDKWLVNIPITHFIRLLLIIKGKNTILAYRSTNRALIVQNIFATSENNYLWSSISCAVHINTVRSNNAIIDGINHLIRGTLETNTAETQRIRNLHREDQSILNIRNLARSTRQLHTTVQRGIPSKLLAQPLLCRFINSTNRVRISNKVGGYILNTLLHRRRIYLHIVILRNGQIAGIVHTGRRIRTDLVIRGYSPDTCRIQATITVPVKNNRSSLASSGPHGIWSQHKPGTFDRNLVKDIGQLIILGRTTKYLPQRKLANAIGTGHMCRIKGHLHGHLHLHDKVRTITLLGSRTHVTACSTSRV